MASGRDPSGSDSHIARSSRSRISTLRRSALNLSTQQLDALRARLADGVARGAERLCQRHTPDSGAELREFHCCCLATFAEGAVCSDDDLVAGAVARFEGGITGTALFAMDPQNALDWVQAGGPKDEPITAYLELGAQMLGGVVEGLARGSGADASVGAASLAENCVAAILLQTHAPSDTAVISVRFDLAAGALILPAFVYVLMEPKALETLEVD